LHHWLAAIQGDLSDAGAIGEIIGKADGLSVARNLSGGKNVQLPTAKAKPLVERLVTGLRYLLDNGDLPMNRRGAAAYLDGDTLWLVSKTTLDKLRTHLIEEGQPGIPTRNDRLMDELQQHDLLVPNEDRAVWLCSITIADWQQQLTCLRFQAGQIWPNSSRQPDSMKGSVEPIHVEQTDTGHATANAAGASLGDESDACQAMPAAAPGSPPHVASEASVSMNDTADADSFDGLPLPFDVNVVPTAGNETVTASESSAANTAETATAAPHPGDGQVDGMDASEDAGRRFLAWLKQSIERESVPINTPKARIHVLPEGLALVSPQIFRDFDAANWSHAQKRFQKLRLHRKTPNDDNIWTCRVAGSRTQALLKAILIPDAAVALGVKLPPPNSAINLLEP
jgi:hypothetical protein